MSLAADVYSETSGWPAAHRFGLSSQTQRAATSVPANIAEGYERHSPKEYQRFLAIACGSLAELETHLRLASLVGIDQHERCETLIERTREVARIIRGIERGLGRKLGPGPWALGPRREA